MESPRTGSAELYSALYRRMAYGDGLNKPERHEPPTPSGFTIRDTAEWQSALRPVAQTGSPPYRRLPTGDALNKHKRHEPPTLRGFPIRDTADWQSALRPVARTGSPPYCRLPTANTLFPVGKTTDAPVLAFADGMA